ncbi:2-amino-4-hydroxy-6-hydroxymethyldihydropteridine diphosphokinase [Reinekea marinisedimentorum]|uniref:2-amino-4-hydroxy-6-hydroxymethyldihydropteridine pyrophosphokinase n=1 Tax=Reinekea marinisedimentorum TaxID=230495 RepID=A0A4V2UJV5_9GAMM|nr:2-amino-4-hydroxy-6-hydroxymethyldihydropteridine diphosphokinase [Reinekea marinisedimentorum]TCS41638.1 2-amino-4-hydroxy-6-hydroxymethyldihydropteridine diphosphokinase [Reinekea marinisedimentorum]
MNKVYVALGSNLGVPSDYIQQAITRLAGLPATELQQVSPWYKTAPVGGPKDQPDYINAACLLLTELTPEALLTHLQAIETDNGRVREVRWGARTLDLDIIWYEGFSSNEEKLSVPHPRAHLRAFVLQPLIDLNADFKLQGSSLSALLTGIDDQAIEPFTNG